jgi:hypothetical protein
MYCDVQYTPKYTVLKLAYQYRISVLYILAHTVFEHLLGNG